MKLLLSLLSEHFENIKETLSGNVINDTEGEYSALQLKNYLLMRNSRRILVFAAMQFIAGIISLAVSLAGMAAAGAGVVLCVTASVLLTGTGILFFSFYYQELERRQPDMKRLNVYFYIFWAAFICGGTALSAGEYQSAHTVYCFIILSATLLVVPILRLYDSIIVTAVLFLEALVYGFTEGHGFLFYFTALFLAMVFIWIYVLKYNCYAGMWLSERSLDVAAERCHQISQTDSLTGMLNKAGLTAKFYERYGESGEKGEGHRIAVILIDVDNFRYYNHRYGYDNSDVCLSRVCSTIRIFAKPVTSMVSRFGGDDFVLILEDMHEVELLRFAEQMRRGVETMALPIGDKSIVTISIGISSINEMKGRETYSQLLNEADTQLMIAKKNGKNCIGYRGRAFISDERRMTR